MKIFFFSATGNCLAVAKKIGGELISIPQALHDGETVYRDEAIGFVFPVFDGTWPRIVAELLSSKGFEAEYFFAVATYGFFPGNTGTSFRKLAARHGISLDYSAELLMVDNYLPLFDVEQELKKLPGKRVEQYLSTIAAEIAARTRRPAKASVVRSVGALFERPMLNKTNSGLAARDFTVSRSCILCGTCARVCPAGNITVADKVSFGRQCYSCFACIHNCPKGALHVKWERSDRRWRNPEVTLKELIDANRQK